MTDQSVDRSVDRGAVAVWRWTALFSSLFVFLVCGFVAIMARLPAGLAIALLLLLLIALALIVWRWPPAKYRHLSYRVDATGVVIRDGIFWRTQSALARTRIQHTDVYQGPLQRHYGVATLKLYTAGSHHTKIELPGLAHATALALREELQREGHHDDAI